MKFLVCILIATFTFSAMADIVTSCNSSFGKFVITQDAGSSAMVEYSTSEGRTSWLVSEILILSVKEILEDDVGTMMAKTAGLRTESPQFSSARYYNLSDDRGAFGIMSFRDDKGIELGNSLLIINSFSKCK